MSYVFCKLNEQEFSNFLKGRDDNNWMQTVGVAKLRNSYGSEIEYLGVKDGKKIVCASMFTITKTFMGKKTYYAPRGFLIDYNDKDLVKDFADALAIYYEKKNILFIKINPNIIISKYDKRINEFKYNDNIKINDYLKKNKFQELKKNKYFEAILPTYSPIVNLKTFAYKNLDKNVRNKISKCYRKGLFAEKKGFDSLKELYPLIKNKTKKSLKYYESLYREFSKNNMIDIFLIRVNFEEYLINTKEKYELALEKNNKLAEKLFYNKSEKLINRKLQSDRELLTYKNDIVIATNGLAKNKNQVVAGAIVIKYNNKVNIYTSGYDKKYKELNANDFLYYKIIEYYKYNYNYLDLDGFSGDLSDSNPYKGLNDFKMGFKPDIYEYIGEFDIIFKKRLYNKLSSNGTLTKIFNRL